jgi:hypothetical protein
VALTLGQSVSAVDTAGTLTFSHTCVSAAQYLYVICCNDYSTNGAITGITYNGVAMTLVGRSENTTGVVETVIYRLASPALESAYTVEVTTPSAGGFRRAAAYSFSGIDTTTPNDAAVTQSSFTAAPSVSVPNVEPIDYVIGGSTCWNSGASAGPGSGLSNGAGQSDGFSLSGYTIEDTGSTSYEQGSGTVAHSYTNTVGNAQTATIAVRIRAPWTGPTFVSAGNGSATATSAASLAPTLPAGRAVGDFMVLHVMNRGTAAPSGVTAGWTLLASDTSNSTVRHWLYCKWATTEETAPSITWGAVTTVRAARVYNFRNVHPSMHESLVTQINTSSVTQDDCDVTTQGTNRLVVNFLALSDDNPVSPFSNGWTESVAEYVSSLGSDCAISLQHRYAENVATYGGGSLTVSAASVGAVIGLAFLPDDQFWTGFSNDGDCGGFSAGAAGSFSFSPSVAIAAGKTAILLMHRATSGAATISVADTKGNTWTKDGEFASLDRLFIFSAPITNALTTSDTITITVSAGSAMAGRLIVVSGLVTSAPADQVASGNDASTPYASGASGTTTQPEEVVFGIISVQSSAHHDQMSTVSGWKPQRRVDTLPGYMTIVKKALFATGTFTVEAVSTTNASTDMLAVSYKASIAGGVDYPVSLAAGLTLAPAQAKLRAAARTQAAGLLVTPLQTRALILSRTQTATLPLIPVLVKISSRSRTQTATLTLTPTQARAINRLRAQPVTLTLAPTMLKQISKSIAAGLVLVPTQARVRMALRTHAVGLTFIPTQTRQRLVDRALAAILTLTPTQEWEKHTGAVNTPVSLAAILTLAPTMVKGISKTLAVGLILTPTQAKTRAALRTLAAMLTLTPSQARLRAVERTLAATLTLTPTQARVVARNRLLAANLILTPNRTISVGKAMAVVLNLIPTQAKATSPGRRLDAVLSLSPTQTLRKSQGVVLSASLALTGAQSRVRGAAKVLNSTLTLVPTQNRLISASRTFAANLLLQPALSRKITKTQAVNLLLQVAQSRKSDLFRIFNSDLTLTATMDWLKGRLVALVADLPLSPEQSTSRGYSVQQALDLILDLVQQWQLYHKEPEGEDFLLASRLDPATLLAVGPQTEGDALLNEILSLASEDTLLGSALDVADAELISAKEAAAILEGVK